MTARFYRCPHCGNVIVKLVDSGVEPVCCGETMTVMEPVMLDVAREKHVPFLLRQEDGKLCVKVGEVPHPMSPEHHICFIAAETCHGLTVHYLDKSAPAETIFNECCDDIKAIYAYCNLHGLWVNRTIPDKTTTCPAKKEAC